MCACVRVCMCACMHTPIVCVCVCWEGGELRAWHSLLALRLRRGSFRSPPVIKLRKSHPDCGDDGDGGGDDDSDDDT